MEVPVYDMQGQEVGRTQLDDSVFGVPIHEPVMHQAVVRQLANARVGTAATKTRGMVRGAGRKLYRQKGTGRARHGDIRSPIHRGGGVVFGPHPRGYEQDMPRKMRRLAIRSALSSKLAGEQLVVVDAISFAEPRTREMVAVLQALGVGNSTLILLPEVDDIVIRSARNIPRVKTLPATAVNVVDVLTHDYLVMPLEAVRQVERTLRPASAEQSEVEAEARPADGVQDDGAADQSTLSVDQQETSREG